MIEINVCVFITGLPIVCSFEFDFCGLTQRQDDQFDWELRTGGTETADTGPNGAYQGSRYMYAEASTPRAPNDMAV